MNIGFGQHDTHSPNPTAATCDLGQTRSSILAAVRNHALTEHNLVAGWQLLQAATVCRATCPDLLLTWCRMSRMHCQHTSNQDIHGRSSVW